jgi:hypothetical protein
MSAILDQMNRRCVVTDALEIERNAHAVGRRGAEKRIKSHMSLILSLAPVCSIASAAHWAKMNEVAQPRNAALRITRLRQELR